MIIVPSISIKPHGIAIYDQYLETRPRREDDFPKPYRWRRPRQNDPEGIVSPKAARRIQAAIKWLLFFSKTKRAYNRDTRRWVKFRISLITVTLSSPQRHSDQVIKSRLFNQLLTELREQNGMIHYVWRAEKQENGNIHFHLLTNIFINAAKLREKWNRIQNKLGYVDAYTDRMSAEIHTFTDYYNRYINQADTSTLRRRYIAGHASGWRNPNSTDVHSVRKVRDLTRYLCKYLCKNLLSEYKKYEDIPPRLLVRGKLWGLSRTLSALRSVTAAVDRFVFDDLTTLCTEFAGRIIRHDYCTFVPATFRDIIRLGCSAILRCIYERLKEVGVNILQLT